MQNTVFDVCIVGAGPAGAFLAYLLSKRGMRVLLVDKSPLPRDKVCGGGLSNKTLELLPFSIAPVVSKRITGAFLTYRNKDTIIKELGGTNGVAVLRSEFDEFLVHQAIEAGATFQPGTEFLSAAKVGAHLHVSTSAGIFLTNYLAGADGAASRVRDVMFGRNIVISAPAVEALITVDQEKLLRMGSRVLFDFGAMPKGYGWIFPKRDHLNVGVFSIFPSKSINKSLDKFIDLYDILSSPRNVKKKGFIIPLRNVARVYEMENVFLLGDAAGFAESFYGEGIYYALKSASLLDQAFSMRSGNYQPYAYTRLARTHLRSELFYSELNAKLFFSMQKFGYYKMVRNAHVNDYFSGLIDGRVGHKECFYKTIATLPYWYFSKTISPSERPPL